MHTWTVAVMPIVFGAICITLMAVLKRIVLRPIFLEAHGEIGRKSVSLLSTLEWLILAYGTGTVFFIGLYLARWGTTWPMVLPKFWTAIICGSMANVVIQFLNAKAASLDKGEVSLTAPLQAMTPGLITVLAITLGEFPGKIGVIGVLLMIMGSYVLLWEKTPEHWADYFGPLRRLRLLLHWRHLNVAERNKTLVVLMALGSAAMGTIGLLFDGLYTRRGINNQGLVLAASSITGILTLTYLLWYLLYPDNRLHREARIQADPETLTVFRKRLLLFALIFGVLWVTQILLVQPIFNKTFVAYVGTLKRFSVLFTVLAGYLFFGETEFRKRLWAAVLIIAGAVCISLDQLPSRLSAKLEIFGL